MTRRSVLLLSLLAALLVISTAWAWGRMVSQRDAAALARRNLWQVRRDAEMIRLHHERPAVALDSERLVSETTRLIEQAALEAGIEPEHLSRINPGPAAALGRSAYLEKPTQVLLLNVTLEQVITFAHHLAGAEGGLTTRSIRLSAPRYETDDTLWTVDLVFTYLIYDPDRADG